MIKKCPFYKKPCLQKGCHAFHIYMEGHPFCVAFFNGPRLELDESELNEGGETEVEE